MLNRARELLRSFDREVLAKEPPQPTAEAIDRRSCFDYKGNRRNTDLPDMAALSPEELARVREYAAPAMQPRRVRLKNIGYLALFTLWNVGAVVFIMHRVGGNDLGKLQAEAEERIRLARKGA